MAKKALLLALTLIVGLSSSVLAQRTTATIRGTVTSSDSTSALPGAKVTVRNVATGFERTVMTNDEGNFNVGDLQVGIYQLTTEYPDFKSTLIKNIELNVADVREINVALEIGEMTEEITVTSPSLVVETIGGEVATVISGEEAQELPLNGRNFAQLTQLMPGVSSPDGLDFKNKGVLSGVDTSVSGSSVTGNQWNIDGANNNDVGSNRTIMVTPSVEAIEEFKIHRNSYGPEFGGAGGAQINLVTKSGTNSYKGSTYMFYRTDSLNEPNAFLEEAGLEKEEIDRKDYGLTLGGPILRDKVRFFVSGERNDETRGTVRSAVVPTAAERAGDFSGPRDECSSPIPVDPLTGMPFPGNVIPTDRLSDAGLTFLTLYPQPNASVPGSCNNWVTSVPTDIDWNQANARLDYTVTDSTSALLRYTRDDWDNTAPNAGANNGLWGDDPFPTVDSGWNQPGDSLVAQINQVFGSDIVNTFTFSKSGNSITTTRGESGAALNAQLNTLIPPTFGEDGKLNPVDRSHPVYWGGATGMDLWNMAPWNNEQDLVVYKNDYQQVFGDHWFKAGVLYGDSEKQENCCGASAFESPHFWGGAGIEPWGATSGNRIADILLDGMYHGFDETETQPAPVLEWEDLEFYIGDSWKVASSLTVDFGVRYSRHDAPVAQDNNIVAFVPEAFDPALGNDACNGVTQAPGTDPCGDVGLLGGVDGVNRGFVADDTDNFAPRLGAAWDISGNGTSVIRAGFGQYFQRERVNVQLDFGGQPPFTQNVSGLRLLDDPTVVSGGTGFGVPNRGIDPNNETPYNFQFNLTWEQRLGRDTTLEIGYVGNRGRHLLRKYDVNGVSSADTDGNGVSDRLDFVRGGGDGNGSVRPYFNGSGNTILYWVTDGESEYDSLQTQFQTRFGRNSRLQASYTYSSFKANDPLTSSSAGTENSQITDIENPDLDWGYAGLHRDHIFNASALWNLPTLQNTGGLMQAIFGNWSMSGVVAYASGAPLTVYTLDIPGLGGGGYAGTGFDDNTRPIRLDNVSCSGSGSQVINPNAYTLNGLRLGDTSQMAERGDCDGPDYFQVDLAFYKNIRLPKGLEGQFRIEIFNITDEVNYIGGSVETNIRPTNVVLDAPLESATTIVSADIPGNFGQATAVRDPRQVQLGFKISF